MDNEYEVKVTRQALEQMREIIHYISYNLMSPEAAERLMNDLKVAIMKLSVLPKRNSTIDEEPWKSEGIRKIIVKNFIIYYWVDDEFNKVQVIAVIYNKRDQIKQLINIETL